MGEGKNITGLKDAENYLADTGVIDIDKLRAGFYKMSEEDQIEFKKSINFKAMKNIRYCDMCNKRIDTKYSNTIYLRYCNKRVENRKICISCMSKFLNISEKEIRFRQFVIEIAKDTDLGLNKKIDFIRFLELVKESGLTLFRNVSLYETVNEEGFIRNKCIEDLAKKHRVSLKNFVLE